MEDTEILAGQPEAAGPEAAGPEATGIGDLIGHDVVEKVNAGAALVHALYHLPAAKVVALFDGATPGFMNIWMRAQNAYAITRGNQ